MAKKRVSRRTAEEWRKLFEEQQASGISGKAFCEKRGIAPASLYLALKRLVKKAEFVDVTPDVRRWESEVVFPNGVVIRMRGSHDASV